MTLKKKLSWGLGFLFMIIFTLFIFCSYYIQKLSKESENILRDNYDSIVYSKKMIHALDDMVMSATFRKFNPDKSVTDGGYYSGLLESAKTEFEKNLKAENNNITELHEKEYVEILKINYPTFIKLGVQINNGRGSNKLYFSKFLPIYKNLQKALNDINDVNMQAIVRKNQLTKKDSSNIIISMAIIGIICIILAFGYIWYFPFYISNSMSYLSGKMKDLLKKVGISREIKTDDEMHIILESLNLIENRYSLNADTYKKTKSLRKKRR